MMLAGIEGGDGERGLPLVLLHGLFGAARNFGAIVRTVGAERRVIALDLRNHGDSPHASGMDYDTMARDVLESLAARGALPCALVGHSMGGKVAMRAALRDPEAVVRLLVSDIAPVAYAPASIAYARAMTALPLRPGLTRAAADAFLATTVPEAPLRAFLLQNLAVGPMPRWRIGLEHILTDFDAIGGWPDLPAGTAYAGPTLFVAGARSAYILPKYRPAIRTLFPASHFVTVKEAGHWVHADNPAGFMAVLRTFLAAA